MIELNSLAATIDTGARDLNLSGGVVSRFFPVTVSASELQQRQAEFEARFIETMAGKGRSLLSSDVYHDGRAGNLDQFKGDAADFHSLDILLTRNAWKAVNSAKSPNDQNLIDSALQDGLLDFITESRIHLVSYGPGPNGTATDKEGRIIAKAIECGRQVEGFTGIDVNRTFAVESSSLLGDKFSIAANGILGDFVWGRPNGLPEVALGAGIAKIVTAFGNTPFNAASYDRDGRVVKFQDSVENFFSKMNRQNGLGHYLVLSVDTDQNPRSQERRYAVTQEHEQLILTPFARARVSGLIDKPYSILAHWRMVVRYDTKENTVLMMAQSKLDHEMPLKTGSIRFREGEERVVMASHKWADHVHVGILTRSGYDVLKVFDDGSHNPHKLILAQAVRDPSREPF